MMAIQFFRNIGKWQSTISVYHNLTFLKPRQLLIAINQRFITNQEKDLYEIPYFLIFLKIVFFQNRLFVTN